MVVDERDAPSSVSLPDKRLLAATTAGAFAVGRLLTIAVLWWNVRDWSGVGRLLVVWDGRWYLMMMDPTPTRACRWSSRKAAALAAAPAARCVA